MKRPWQWRDLLLVVLAAWAVFIALTIKPRHFQWEKKTLPVHVQDTANVTRFTKNFSYTETEGGRTLYTLDAEEVLGIKNTLYQLRNVRMTFPMEGGRIALTCREASFDIQAKDAFAQGRVYLEMPDGLRIWTEEIAYRNSTRMLEGSGRLSFTWRDFYWGGVESVGVNVLENAVELKNLRLDGPDAFLQAPLLKGAFKERRYTFPEGVAFRWGTAQASLATLSVAFPGDAAEFFGACLDGVLEEGPGYLLTGERLTGRAVRAGGWRLETLGLQDGAALDTVDHSRQGGAEELRAEFEEGRPVRFRLRDEVFLREREDEINAGAAVLTLDAERKMENAYFSEGAWGCAQGWYFSSEELQYIPQERLANLRDNVHARSKGMVLDGAWVKVSDGGQKVEAGGGVFARDDSTGYSVKAQAMDLQRREKRTTFRREVLAWSADTTVKAALLSFTGDRWLADGGVETVTIQGGDRTTLTCWTLTYDGAAQTLDALGSVAVVSKTERLSGYHLVGFQKDNKFTRLILTDGVYIEQIGQKRKGTGDALDVYPQEGWFVLEGCPAVMEDPGEGTLRADTILGVQKPPQLFLLDETGGATLQRSTGAKAPELKLKPAENAPAKGGASKRRSSPGRSDGRPTRP